MNQDLVTDRTLDTTSNILDIDANILELLIRNFEFNFCFITEEIWRVKNHKKFKIQTWNVSSIHYSSLPLELGKSYRVWFSHRLVQKKDLRVLEYPSRACWVILCMPYESFMKKIMGFDMDKYSIGI